MINMNSNEVHSCIVNVGATSSKRDKERMITIHIEDPLFKRVCQYAYDPFKTYGIRQIPVRVPRGDGMEFNEATWNVLDDLISRNLTGNTARDVVQNMLDHLNEDSADLFVRIIRKDLRAGFSESTINKAAKGTIPTFPYQRCSLPKDTDLQKWPWDDGAISQEKADGMFANVDHELNGLVSIRSRQGTEFPMEKFECVADDIRAALSPGFQQHGEFVVMRDGVVLDRATGNGIMNHVISGGSFATNENPVYLIWDQIPLDSVVSKGKCLTPYKTRFTNLVRQVAKSEGDRHTIGIIPTRIVYSLKDAYAHASELMKEGKEGSVIKHPGAIWKDGTSKEQIKLKLEFEVDLKIVGIVAGRDGTKNEGRAGSLSCISAGGDLLVDVAVKNEAVRDLIDANPGDWIGRIMPVTANDIILPGKNNVNHSLFLPRMSEAAYRTDKVDADSLSRVFAQKEAAILGKQILDGDWS